MLIVLRAVIVDIGTGIHKAPKRPYGQQRKSRQRQPGSAGYASAHEKEQYGSSDGSAQKAQNDTLIQAYVVFGRNSEGRVYGRDIREHKRVAAENELKIISCCGSHEYNRRG